MTRKSLLITTIAVLVAAGMLFFLATMQKQAASNRATQEAASSSTTAGSGSDLVELNRSFDPEELAAVSFVSIFVPNAQGQLTSYMLDANLPAAQALIQAVREAKQSQAEEGAAQSECAITFVLPTRQTVTFALHLETGLLYRQGQAYRPPGDLKVLINTAINTQS